MEMQNSIVYEIAWHMCLHTDVHSFPILVHKLC